MSRSHLVVQSLERRRPTPGVWSMTLSFIGAMFGAGASRGRFR